MRFSLLIIGSSILAMVVLSALLLQLQHGAGHPPFASGVRVFCAAGMVPVIQSSEMLDGCPAPVQIVRSGGSGELAGQVVLQAESIRSAELLVLADADLLQQLYQQGIVVETFPLAWQRPVIAVSQDFPWQVTSLTDLLDNPAIRLGIGAEQSAIGSATRQYAQQEGHWSKLKQRAKMQTENVMTLGQALTAGSLDAVIVWDTTVAEIQRTGSSNIRIAAPLDSTDRLRSEIGIGLTLTGKQNPAARKLAYWWASSPELADQLQRQGYSPSFHEAARQTEQP